MVVYSFLCLEHTYKELKPIISSPSTVFNKSLEHTYKELKPKSAMSQKQKNNCLEHTYKELKPLSNYFINQSVKLV